MCEFWKNSADPFCGVSSGSTLFVNVPLTFNFSYVLPNILCACASIYWVHTFKRNFLHYSLNVRYRFVCVAK